MKPPRSDPPASSSPSPTPDAAGAHVFGDQRLLELANTHASADRHANNERLEFLGDAVLDLIAAELLFERLDDQDEGALSNAKAWLVSRRTLAEAARELDLQSEARFGPGLAGRGVPTSVLANLYEARLGAIYLDAGLEAARAFVVASLSKELEQAASAGTERNHKQRLQEWAQTEGGDPPEYHQLEERGDAHRRAFKVQAEVRGRRFPAAWGRTRKDAERWAAQEALEVLERQATQGGREADA